jgi:hypothetical protein
LTEPTISLVCVSKGSHLWHFWAFTLVLGNHFERIPAEKEVVEISKDPDRSLGFSTMKLGWPSSPRIFRVQRGESQESSPQSQILATNR